jgi:hypothetical protein
MRYNYYILSILIMFNISLSGFAQSNIGSVITDPSISKRCEALTLKRTKKIKHKQKLAGLVERNKRLQKITPKAKVTVKEKLTENLYKLNRELRLTRIRIDHLTEDIVRKGCPGIIL